VQRALATRHAEGKAEGKAEAIIAVLAARGVPPSEAERARILATRDDATLQRWLEAVARGADAQTLR